MTEIALKTTGVLKHPGPDVLFVDHADSALMFCLRVWIDADDYGRR